LQEEKTKRKIKVSLVPEDVRSRQGKVEKKTVFTRVACQLLVLNIAFVSVKLSAYLELVVNYTLTAFCLNAQFIGLKYLNKV